MTRAIRIITSLYLMLSASLALAQEAELVSFVTCPIYRDTDQGVKSGCWLADERASGRRFDISASRTKPLLGREILVEGRLSTLPDACGGITLTPVRVSVLPSHCPRALIPAEGHPGRRFPPPPSAAQPIDVPRPIFDPPYTYRRIDLSFDFGKAFLIYQYSEAALEHIALYARSAKAKRVVVTGYAATAPLTISGRTLVEDKEIAQARADIVAEALRRLDISPAVLEIRTGFNAVALAEDPDKLAEPSRRRATIEVFP